MALAYCAVGRRRLTRALLAVRPRVFVHGHFHVHDERMVAVDGWKHPVVAVSLGADGDLRGNLALLHLPGRAERGLPEIEWVDLSRSTGTSARG